MTGEMKSSSCAIWFQILLTSEKERRFVARMDQVSKEADGILAAMMTRITSAGMSDMLTSRSTTSGSEEERSKFCFRGVARAGKRAVYSCSLGLDEKIFLLCAVSF